MDGIFPVLFIFSMENKNILILGIGNLLLGDEGFGIHAVEYLQHNYDWPENIKLLDGGTRGLLLMADIMDNDLVIILDIVLAGQQAGTIYLIEDGDMDTSIPVRQTAHQTGIGDVMVSCELAGHRPEILVLGIEPDNFHGMNIQLSPVLQDRLPVFCAKLVEEMRKRDLL